MTGITPCIWFDRKAEEAANFYVSIFPNSRILKTSRYTDAGPLPKGEILTVSFELDGQEFTALNGGPEFKPNEGLSLMIKCENQAEVDRYWSKLSADPSAEQCGWLKDKYGVSWQVVPNFMLELITDKDTEKVDRVMRVMMNMKKLDLEELKRAAAGEHARA